MEILNFEVDSWNYDNGKTAVCIELWDLEIELGIYKSGEILINGEGDLLHIDYWLSALQPWDLF